MHFIASLCMVIWVSMLIYTQIYAYICLFQLAFGPVLHCSTLAITQWVCRMDAQLQQENLLQLKHPILFSSMVLLHQTHKSNKAYNNPISIIKPARNSYASIWLTTYSYKMPTYYPMVSSSNAAGKIQVHACKKMQCICIFYAKIFLNSLQTLQL